MGEAFAPAPKMFECATADDYRAFMTIRVPKVDGACHDIRHGHLLSLSRLVGSGYRAVGRGLDGGTTVARGEFALRQVRPGLLLHASDARYERTVTTHLVKERSLNFSIVVRGGWQAILGGIPLACGGQYPQATAFVLSEADEWRKRTMEGGHARMVNVMVSPNWLEESGLESGFQLGKSIHRLTRRHRWNGQWRPSSRIVALAEQILGVPRYTGVLQKLYLESRAIEIVVDALAILADDSATSTSVSPADHRRMHLVLERLDAAVDDIPSLSVLARDARVSIRTLQRQFALVHGVGVLDYARRRRLDFAHNLLEREGVTVAQAAYHAGYAHPANFATAFKRRFGLSPSQVRTRL